MNLPPQDSQIDEFLAKYSPEIETQLREARARLRAFFEHGFELVFDNYNALVFGISPTERAKDAFISVAGYPKWVTLFFLNGKSLRDPAGLLQGSGKQVRSIRLKTPEDIDKSEIHQLILQAIHLHESALDAAPLLTTRIKMVVAEQRPRWPASKSDEAPISPPSKPSRAKA